jgi:phosphate-selective porin OprO/OprP
LQPYDHILSLWHQGQAGPFGLGVELVGGHGIEGHKSVLGVTVLPTYALGKNLLRKGDALEAALRYQYAISDGDNGLKLQKRYEQEVVPRGLGNAYHAVYLGLNYLIFGDRLKLMNGLEYSLMKNSALGHDSFNGWTFMTGVRLYF